MKIQEEIQNFTDTYNQIKCVTHGKILGQITEPDKKVNKAIEDRIKKARGAWISLRRTLIANNNIGKKLKLILFQSLIGSILRYGLTTLEINSTQMKNSNPSTQDV